MENTKELEVKAAITKAEKEKEEKEKSEKQYLYSKNCYYLAPGICLGLLSFLEAVFGLGNVGYIISVVLVILSAPRFCYDVMREMGKIKSDMEYYLAGSILNILNFVFIFLTQYHISLAIISIIIGILNIASSLLYSYLYCPKFTMVSTILAMLVVLIVSMMISGDAQLCVYLLILILLSFTFVIIQAIESDYEI